MEVLNLIYAFSFVVLAALVAAQVVARRALDDSPELRRLPRVIGD